MAAAFSYAQAAKGITSTLPSSTPSESNTPVSKLEEQIPEQTSEDVVAPRPDEANDAENATDNADKELSSASSKAEVSGTSSPSAGTVQTSTTSKDEEGSSTQNDTSESDKQSQISGSDKQQTTADGAKGKNSGKEKPAPPKELKAAPIPAVNVWQQRKEAQEAKAKAAAALKPAVKAEASKPTSESSSISGDNQDQSKSGSKKSTEGIKDRKKADGKGREEIAPVPPVADAAAWPTPQGAQGEEKKKAQDKTEKNPLVRPHGKEKWMPVPYVPTAVFSTPLPPAARRGGRSGRGGRDSGRGAGAAEKGTLGQAAQGPAAKSTSGDRGRNDPNPVRANSLPAQSRRSNSADNAPTDARKPPAGDRNRGPKATDNANAPSAAKIVNGESFPRHAKPFPRNNDGPHKGGDKNPQLSVDPHAGPRSGPNNERRFENGPKSADFAGIHDRERKDKEFSRESRADRGRGGHRGRGGGHAAYTGTQASHFPNSHMAHNGYMHPKTFGYNDRQRTQQHGFVNGSRGHAMTMRSPSLPNSNAMYGVYPYPADMNAMYGYQPVQAGPMSAVPYQYVEPFSLVSMISMQLEYYFSVDNLCKDLYLRKHMDSQGYVVLSFIAAFKRVKSLTEDFEMIRHVSRHLKNAEYYTGEDGVDRLRPKEWEQWVLPPEQRDPSAQNAGPVPSTKQNDVAPQNHLDGATNGFVPKSSLPNGTSEPRVSKTPLSSAAPEFSPSNGANAGSEISN